MRASRKLMIVRRQFAKRKLIFEKKKKKLKLMLKGNEKKLTCCYRLLKNKYIF